MDCIYFLKLLEVVGLHLILPRFPSACNNPHTVPAAFCEEGKHAGQEQTSNIRRESLHTAEPEQAVIQGHRQEAWEGLHVNLEGGEKTHNYSPH